MNNYNLAPKDNYTPSTKGFPLMFKIGSDEYTRMGGTFYRNREKISKPTYMKYLKIFYQQQEDELTTAKRPD